MTHLRDHGPHVLPIPSHATITSGSNAKIEALNTTIPLRTHYTGVKQVDEQLTTLLVFFWEQVSGAREEYWPFNFHFAGGIAVGWALLTLEGLRKGGRRRVVGWTWAWGIGVQTAAWAVVGPVWLAVHLLTAGSAGSEGELDVEVADVWSIPPAVVVGYVIPTLLMAKPAQATEEWEKKQLWTVIWQAFPVWVSLSRLVFARSLKARLGGQEGRRAHGFNSLQHRRSFYSVLLGVAVAIQVTAFWTATSQAAAANLAGTEKFRYVFDLFKPCAISPATKMGSIGEGAHLLLQWDELNLIQSLLLWSAALLHSTVKSQGIRYRDHKAICLGSLGLSFVLPLGFAVSAVWLRDELAFKKEDVEKKKR